MKTFLTLLLLCGCISTQAIEIDRNTKSFEMRKKKRVDVFDFSGEYPELENIDIDARRKKRVDFLLTGNYPVLERLNYEGSFGLIKGKLTGDFPKLSQINFICTNSAMTFDLCGQWKRDCTIVIVGAREDVSLSLPKDVGIVVHTKTAPGGKIFVDGLEKKGWGLWKKTYMNELAETAEVVLTLEITVDRANIILQ